MQSTPSGFRLSATDLSNHLACHHLSELNRAVALGQIKKPGYNDPALAVLEQRGLEHEQAYVDYLKSKKLSVTNVKGQSIDATVQAMQQGADVIVQARLEDGPWVGLADILLKVAGQSRFGNWSYEVQDTKLAQNTRAGTILQLCLYTELLAIAQGSVPEKMYVVKPGTDFPTDSYHYAEFQAYYRLVKHNFLDAINQGPQLTYPDPVEHCTICRWWMVCQNKRRQDDHLSLVAGMRTLQIEELEKQQIHTLEAFATAQALARPARGNKEALVRKQAQAQVQLEGRRLNQLQYKQLQHEAGRGLYRLPQPNAGDLYFDIEGDAFYDQGGLEYLLGYALVEKDGTLTYHKAWATHRVEEKHAFEAFMQFVIKRWQQFPDFYIYHFAPYEPSAIKRLARVHAVYEKEVDDLLRAERFIDLHAIFKESLLASVERYSLKELEQFTTYTRIVELHDASVARKTVECALELHDFKTLPPTTIDTVERYNEDDCRATHALHHWLEARRAEQGITQRPEIKTGDASEKVQQLDSRAQAIFKSLTINLPEDRDTWTAEQHAQWLLAHQIEYFRREDKSAWWEFFRVHELEHEDLLEERKAITGLQYQETLPLKGKERIAAQRYTYPPQEISMDEGDELIEVKGEKIGSVQAISQENLTIDIKKTAKTIDVHPHAVHVSERVDPGSLATSLMNLADSICDDGFAHQWPYHAAKDLLMKRPPVLLGGTTGATLLPNEDTVTGAIRLALNLDRSVLPIQGPPGSGKTYTGAKMILALQQAGKKIGITAISHKVIRNLIDKTLELARQENINATFIHKLTDKSETVPEGITETGDSKKVIAALAEGKIAGGTAWLWSEDASVDALDYLFVDEAGQMSLSQVLAASRAARNLILLGDPQQLEQPQKGAHPEGSDVAALTYLLDGQPTISADKGLFLATTRRLHPNICRFTSELYYEGRLQSLPGLENQQLTGSTPFDGAGLFYKPVTHHGNQSRADEEVKAIQEITQTLLSKGKYTNAAGETRALKTEDILIVAPYNAQVAALKQAMPDLRIGTVDKFQGQEAPVVIYSMTASSIEDAPRGMSFLFNPNRLNVATSRAKCTCILVASPRLFEADCHTIDQMRWANALCRYRELAKEVPAYVTV
jgi:predicted RecB family nuclease